MTDLKQTLSNQEIKHFRSIAHGLKPIVTIAQNGLSENVMKELERALGQHELIKIKVHAEDRETRRELIAQTCDQTGATLIQTIGLVAVIYRPSRKPDPKLSNILRFAQAAH
jgi:RNA-binding protein